MVAATAAGVVMVSSDANTSSSSSSMSVLDGAGAGSGAGAVLPSAGVLDLSGSVRKGTSECQGKTGISERVSADLTSLVWLSAIPGNKS